jgi:hypothetical protein
MDLTLPNILALVRLTVHLEVVTDHVCCQILSD